MTIAPDVIALAYRLLLNRGPSEAELVAMQPLCTDLGTLRDIIVNSPEFSNVVGLNQRASPLFHYNASFDPIAVIRAHTQKGLVAEPDLVTNFIGMKMPATVHPAILQPLINRVEPPPNPGNWHADIAEWGAALRSVDLAQDTYRIVELGCGWGCWLVNMGIAARRRGLNVQLVGIEGDAGHLAHAREILDLNGFDETTLRLHHGVAGAKSGPAIFPRNADWGGQAIFSPDAQTLANASADPSLQILTCYTLDMLTQGEPIDLLHIDIQGAELDFVLGNMPAISRLVRRVLIGTQSRAIEGALVGQFLSSGWSFEIERPAITPIQHGSPTIAIDGVQLWANPQFK